MYPYYYGNYYTVEGRPGPFDIFHPTTGGQTTSSPQHSTPPPPQGAPPAQIPPKPGQLPPGTFGYAPPISIQQCLYKIAYIWPAGGGKGFWFYPYYVDSYSTAGYLWNGFQWMPTGFDLKLIDLITCI